MDGAKITSRGAFFLALRATLGHLGALLGLFLGGDLGDLGDVCGGPCEFP